MNVLLPIQDSRTARVARSGSIAALDIGTTKVCCFVARVDPQAGIRVIGIGHQSSRGLRGGTVIDPEATEAAIRGAVDVAERMAGETVKQVFVNLSCGDPVSHTVGVEVSISGREIEDADLQHVLRQGMARIESGEREVVHAIPGSFTIDGTGGVREPRGMAGSRLGVDMHVVTATIGPLRNVQICVERAMLELEGLVLSGYAAGLSSLVDDERNLGVTLLDMGGGTTSIVVFVEGNLVFADVVPLGGQHVTNDIARGLATPTAQAERMKTLFGNAVPSPADERDMIDVPRVGESDLAVANHVPRSVLTGIIQPRLEETLEMVRDRLEFSGTARVSGRRLVLTGGASQLQGVGELASRVLDKQVRIGRPMAIHGLAEATGGAAFAACAGLLVYGAHGYAEPFQSLDEPAYDSRRGLARIGRWLKRNF